MAANPESSYRSPVQTESGAFFKVAEADIICSLLRANGIRCGERAADVATYGGGGFGGWREILVSEDQLERARELVATDGRPTA